MKTKLLGIGALALVMIACGGQTDEQEEPDSTAADTGSAGMAQMDHSGSPAKDGQHEFLRMMSDHHEGLIQMAMAAMEKGSAAQTKQDAHMLHTKQAAERDSMVAMIQRDYQEQHRPKAAAKNQAQMDSLNAKSGAEYDRTFYRLIVAHHREGIAMVDQHLPHLNGVLRTMAEKMKADQQKEIAEFERKAQAQ